MAVKYAVLFVFFQLFALNVVMQTFAFPTPASTEDKTVYNRQLTEEKPLIDQIAEADSVKATVLSAEGKHPAASKDTAQDSDDFSALKSLAESQKSKMESGDVPDQSSQKSDQFVPDESDSTKSRRLAEDYDSTKNGMGDGKYQDGPESFRQVDGTPLTAEDIVQKIANKIYEEDDRGVFDRIVSRLLKLGLITDSEADSLEYQVAEALQELITKNALKNEVDERAETEESDELRGEQEERDADEHTWDTAPVDPSNDDEEEEGDEGTEEERNMEDREGADRGDMTGDERWDGDSQNEVSPNDGLQNLQYFPNFYRLLRSLDSERDTQERETLITIMKTLIDFVKMMVKYGTITPEEGVSYLENLDAMIALQTKNKLGKSLGPSDLGKSFDEDDNTKAEAAKMQKEYENLKDSTKEEQPSTDTSRPGKSETYLEAIRKNIEWLKKHSKEEGKDDYDLSKLKDFMDQQVDSYIEKGIISKDEGGTIKRIYSSL
ncbi:secretogranin-3 [Boleophthalmus pectinirostris]|uniref:secretogranin-3 n=1 Tax=Boleophthalmus pectinirostris TaxID=150288 RepID=UPI00242A3A7F|nr:secretogranin-3 [Boleophthalmus pectinirostris]